MSRPVSGIPIRTGNRLQISVFALIPMWFGSCSLKSMRSRPKRHLQAAWAGYGSGFGILFRDSVLARLHLRIRDCRYRMQSKHAHSGRHGRVRPRNRDRRRLRQPRRSFGSDDVRLPVWLAGPSWRVASCLRLRFTTGGRHRVGAGVVIGYRVGSRDVSCIQDLSG